MLPSAEAEARSTPLTVCRRLAEIGWMHRRAGLKPPQAREGAAAILEVMAGMARNARFLLCVVEGRGGARVVFCDLPTVPAGPVGRFLVTQRAAVARAARSRQVTKRGAAVLAVLRQVEDGGANSLRTFAAGL